MAEFKITSEEIKEHIKKNPFLKSFFNSTFKGWDARPNDNKPFIGIGQLFLRKRVGKDNLYYLFIEGGYVRVRNLYTNEIFKRAMLRWDKDSFILTQKDFVELMSSYYENSDAILNTFVPVPNNFINKYIDSEEAINHVNNP